MCTPRGARASACLLLAALIALLLSAAAPSAQAARFFGPTSVWNTPVTGAVPLDPSSAALVGTLNAWVDDEVTRKTGPWINTTSYSSPIYRVPAGQPTVRVIGDYGVPELNAAWQHVPMPVDAQAAKGNDEHLAVYQQSTDTMWEFWHLHQRLMAPADWAVRGVVSTGGSLPVGDYVYKVSAMSSRGETTAAPKLGLPVRVASPGGKVTLSWNGVMSATGYRLYRGTPGAPLRALADVKQSTTAYGVVHSVVDTGAATVGAADPPTTNTAATPGEWHAAWGGRMRGVSTHPGFYRRVTDPAGVVVEDASWGSTASSLPVAGGMITLEDLRAGKVDHALQLLLPFPKSGTWSWPAQRTDGTDTRAAGIPEGAHFRLNPTLNIASLNLPPITRMMAEAAQKYGMIVNDGTATAVGFRAEDPTPEMLKGGPNPYTLFFTNPVTGKFEYPNDFLAKFPWRQAQLLKMVLYTNGQVHDSVVQSAASR